MNPILDAKALEELYNVGDYPSWYYTYEDYDDITNETKSTSNGNISEPMNVTTQMLERNDTSDEITVFTAFENYTETSSMDFNNETDSTTISTVFVDESVISDKTTEEDSNDTDTTVNTITSIITEDFDETSFILNTTSSFMQKNDTSDEYSITETVNTSTESSEITTIFTKEFNTETTDEMFTIDDSSTSYESVIPLSNDKEYVVKCFEQICTTTTQDTSM